MKREKNHRNLQRTISHLPEHDPSGAHWAGILNALEEDSAKAFPGKLQQIEPPEAIWELIDKQLQEAGILLKKKPGRIPVWISVAAAAVIILMLVIINPFKSGTYKISYSEEWIQSGNDTQAWSKSDTLIYRQIAQTCRQKPQVCSSDEFSRLKNELDFLEESKQTILNQLNKYDDDRDLEIMLKRIESERTDLLNQMKTLFN